MVIFRETEDIYAGINGPPAAPRWVLDFATQFPRAYGKSASARLKERRLAGRAQTVGARRAASVQVGIGIKPVSFLGTERLVKSAIEYAITNKRKSVTLVHKGQHHEVHRRRLRRLGLQVAREHFGAVELDGGPGTSSRTASPAPA